MGEKENSFKEKREEVKSNFQPQSKRGLEMFKLIHQPPLPLATMPLFWLAVWAGLRFTLELVVGCAGGDLSLVVLHEVLSSGLSAPAEWSPLRWKISCRQRNMLQEAAASCQISLELLKQTPPKTQPL